MKVYLKSDYFIESLQDEFNFKLVKTEKKEVFSGSGYEVDIKTREIRSTSKSDLSIIVRMYDINILDIK